MHDCMQTHMYQVYVGDMHVFQRNRSARGRAGPEELEQTKRAGPGHERNEARGRRRTRYVEVENVVRWS
jgi:hypothetical protein